MEVSVRRQKQQVYIPDNPTLQDLAMAIKMERDAREAAMANHQKHLDWRFVHFQEEFTQRIEQVEQRAKHRSPLEASGSQGCQLAEGKLAVLEARLAEVHRTGDAFEKRLEAHRAELDKLARSRLADIQVSLAQAELRLKELESIARSSRPCSECSTNTSQSPHSSSGMLGGVKVSRLTPVVQISPEKNEAPSDRPDRDLRLVSGQAAATAASGVRGWSSSAETCDVESSRQASSRLFSSVACAKIA
eukprot:TRINITY_DN11512_c0_g1_i1.p1 TRINITY_DN11512_c0_g1~~TRINITY_DN11512_c0_g1_i1.p1  ORF type:complete len:247 (-),score=47.79 TRINITY_DN11512_c0_g1_i1:70-810(-)